MAERHQEIGAVGDLPAPHRRPEFCQRFARNRNDRAFRVVPACRCAVEHDRIGLARRPAHLDRLLHRVDVEHARPRGNDDHGRVLDRIVNHRRQIRRRVDQDPFDSVTLRGRDDAADGIDRSFDRRFVGAAQLVPQGQRTLRIGIDKQTRLCCLDLCSNMSGQGTFSRPPFTRSKNNDVHYLGLQIDPRR